MEANIVLGVIIFVFVMAAALSVLYLIYLAIKLLKSQDILTRSRIFDANQARTMNMNRRDQ